MNDTNILRDGLALIHGLHVDHAVQVDGHGEVVWGDLSESIGITAEELFRRAVMHQVSLDGFAAWADATYPTFSEKMSCELAKAATRSMTSLARTVSAHPVDPAVPVCFVEFRQMLSLSKSAHEAGEYAVALKHAGYAECAVRFIEGYLTKACVTLNGGLCRAFSMAEMTKAQIALAIFLRVRQENPVGTLVTA